MVSIAHSGRKATEHETKPYAKLFSRLGLDLDPDLEHGEHATECPSCGRRKLYVNVAKGTYHCKSCGDDFSGNAYSFVRWYYEDCRSATKPNHYRDLTRRRGIGWQTLQRFDLAWDNDEQRWLIPFHNREGNVVNLQLYYPDRKGNNKFNLPCLGTRLFGLGNLSNDRELVFLCEGAFDAMALDYRLKQNRHKYDILALPGSCYRSLAEHLGGRKVRTLFDNDEGGDNHRRAVAKALGESGAVNELEQLVWPKEYERGMDLNDLLNAEPDLKVVGWSRTHSMRFEMRPRMRWRSAAEIMETDEYKEPVRWIWDGHIPLGEYVSLSGYQKTMKSTICRDLAARVTTGREMPDGSALGIEPSDVMYVTAEDSERCVIDSFREHGGDVHRFFVHGLFGPDGKAVDLLQVLPAIEDEAKSRGCKLLIVDGQNSLLGMANYRTDNAARVNITNRLCHFAQANKITVIAIRNANEHGNPYGAAAMEDQSRCVLRTLQLEDEKSPYTHQLTFHKVSEGADPPAIPYHARGLGRNERNGNRMKLVWKRKRDVRAFVRAFKANRSA